MSVRQRLRAERGAIIIQAATTMLVLLGLTGFVVDYGILWLAREQAQQAADAGAMAGALARAYGDPDPDAPMSTVITRSAENGVAQNPVWSETGASSVVPVCPPEVTARCIRVDVRRDGTGGSAAIPTLFAPLFGITSQGVRATATARVAIGNGTPCLKPWAIPDTWLEASIPPDNLFERYVDGGGGLEVPDPDVYTAPSEYDPGTGMRLSLDLGRQLNLPITIDLETAPLLQGRLLPIVLDGTNTYVENIVACNGRLSMWDRFYAVDASATPGATISNAYTLWLADLSASWNATTMAIEGSCAPDCAPISPRLVALAVFDVEEFQRMRATDSWCAGGPCVKAVNFVGFFIESIGGNGILGRIARYPGLASADYPSVVSTASFLPTVTLVR